MDSRPHDDSWVLRHHGGMDAASSTRGRSLGPLFLSVLCAAVGVVLVVRSYQWMNDDAYFYLKVALNHSRGLGSSFSGLAPTNGYHPLWQWILMGLFDVLQPGVEGGLVAARVLCWVVMVGALVVFLRFGVKAFGTRWGAASVAMLSIFATRGVSCMEFWPAVFLLGLVVFRASRESLNSVGLVDSLVGGCLLALLVLSRLDLVVFVAVLLAANGLQRPGNAKKATWFQAGVVAAVLLAYAIYNMRTFGHAASISSMLKSTFPTPVVPDAATILATKHAWPGWAAAIALCFVPTRGGPVTQQDRVIRILAVATLIHAAMVLMFTRWPAFGIWYWVLSYASLVMFVGEVGRRMVAARGAVVIVAAAGLWHAGAMADAMIRYPDRPEGEMGRQFAAHIPKDGVVFQVDATGMTSYLSDRTIINGDGLMNNREFQTAVGNHALDAYLSKYGVTYIAHDEAEALGNDVASGDYRVAKYDVPFHLEQTTTTLALRREDEVARWTVEWPGQMFPWPRDGHRQTFVVWRRK